MWPHDSNAFTQGLILSDGKLLESTGQEGFSSLRRVELETGKVLKKVDVPVALFRRRHRAAEWEDLSAHVAAPVGFIYDAQSFERVGTV
jgi:glutamine cyclotransferase